VSKHVAFLVAYDYGQGAVWAYIKAESARQINERLPDFTVFEAPPDWMTELELSDIEARMSFDLEKPTGWLASVIERHRKGSQCRRHQPSSGPLLVTLGSCASSRHGEFQREFAKWRNLAG